MSIREVVFQDIFLTGSRSLEHPVKTGRPTALDPATKRQGSLYIKIKNYFKILLKI